MKKEEQVDKLLQTANRFLKDANFEKALKALLAAYEIDRDNTDVLYLLGITYTRTGKYESALYNFGRLMESEIPYINKLHARMVMGYLYTIMEDFDKALGVFREILDAGFESAQVFAAVGYVMDRKGDFKEACMNLYRAIELDPKNANARNSLGYIYTEAGINLEEALEEIKKAVSMDKDNAAYLDSLGWVYYKLGKLSQAKAYLKKAVGLAPDNEEIRIHFEIVQKKS